MDLFQTKNENHYEFYLFPELILELIKANKANPSFVIGVPVGFVNVIEAKEMLAALDVPKIIARGRKGGTTVACAILNALLYGMK